MKAVEIYDKEGNVIALADSVTGAVTSKDESALQVIFDAWQNAEQSLKKLSLIQDLTLTELLKYKQ